MLKLYDLEHLKYNFSHVRLLFGRLVLLQNLFIKYF